MNQKCGKLFIPEKWTSIICINGKSRSQNLVKRIAKRSTISNTYKFNFIDLAKIWRFLYVARIDIDPQNYMRR